ncbi:MAG: hypothetical protein ACLTQI_03880 [Slackia sp.]
MNGTTSSGAWFARHCGPRRARGAAFLRGLLPVGAGHGIEGVDEGLLLFIGGYSGSLSLFCGL